MSLFGKKQPPRAAQIPGVSGSGKIRTDIDCHNCSKQFVAQLDFDINGCHRIGCPHCGHTHYRVIKDGKITEERWPVDIPHEDLIVVSPGSIWKSKEVTAVTTTTALFIRDAWLNRGSEDGYL